MAVLGALLGFCHLRKGFSNREMVKQVRALGTTPGTAAYGTRPATYDLRRLKRKGRIEKQPHTRRYHLTSLGRRIAVLFTKAYSRVLAPGLSQLDPLLPEDVVARSSLPQAWRCFERALDEFIPAQVIAQLSAGQT
jgi:hypothetical protein